MTAAAPAVAAHRPPPPPPTAAPAEPSPSTARRRRLIALLPTAAALTWIAVLYGVNLNGYPEYLNDDEGTYYAQAWAVLHGDLAHYTYWYDHPPLGWLQLALFLKPLEWLVHPLGGSDAEPVMAAGRLFMTGVAVATAAAVLKVARNLGLPRPVALLAMLVWAMCPLTLYLGRQIFLDSIALMWVMVALALVTSRPRLHLHVAAGLAFGAAVLTKETALLAGPGIVLALWQCSWRPTRWFNLVGWASATGMVLLSYLLLAGIKGEILPGAGHVSLVGAVEWQLHGRGGGRPFGMFVPGDGAWALLHGSWLVHDAYLLIGGMLLLPFALWLRPVRPIALVPLIMFLTMCRGGYTPAMFVIGALPFLALTTTYLGHRAWTASGAATSRLLRRTTRPIVVSVLAVGLGATALHWAPAVPHALTADENVPYEQALRYVDANLPRDSVILTDDDTWNDLVALGWNSDGWHGPIWHFKLDRDPIARDANLPGGWKDVDYVLLGRPMTVFQGTEILSAAEAPQAYAALMHSRTIEAWGPPGLQVMLLQVHPDWTPGTASGSADPPANG
jgi:hypothetical protein